MDISVNNIDNFSAQQVFDFVFEKLSQQGRPSMRLGGCVYRETDDNGDVTACCAAGHLLTCLSADDLEPVEGQAWMDLAVTLGICTVHHALIGDLQYAHDAAADVGYLDDADNIRWRDLWSARMLGVATRHGLDRAKVIGYRKTQGFSTAD